MNNNIVYKQKGFTLIELLVVISIIGVLSTVAMTSLNVARKKARDAKRISEIEQVNLALEIYYSDHGYYPQYLVGGTRCNTTVSGSLSALIDENLLTSNPTDPVNSSTSSPLLCYEYIGLGNATSYPFVTGFRCNGRLRTDYKYVLMFSTEATSSNFDLVSSFYKYCIHGPLNE